MTRAARASKPLADRMVDKYEVRDDGRWQWTATLGGGGYGQIWAGGRKGEAGLLYAHRAMYELLVGPIPAGLTLDHLCRNRACVNPEHLEPVTHRENLLRGVGASARNMRKTHCPQGHPLDGRMSDGKRYCLTCNRERAA